MPSDTKPNASLGGRITEMCSMKCTTYFDVNATDTTSSALEAIVIDWQDKLVC